MRKYIFLLIILSISFLIKAQVRTKFNSKEVLGLDGKFKKAFQEATIDLAIPDDQKIKNAEKADSLLTEEKLFRIAIPIGVNIDFNQTASWISDNSFSYGKLILQVAKAKSLSLNFNKFDLPAGTEMYIYNEKGNMITGPITEKENNKNKTWGSSIYKGSILIIEVKTPTVTKNQLALNISNVAYGYKKVFDEKIYALDNLEVAI